MATARIIYAAIKDGKLYEGSALQLAPKINASADMICRKVRENDGITEIKGMTVFRAFDVILELLDVQTGDVIAQGKAEAVSAQMGYNMNWAAHLVKYPSKYYAARWIYSPTEHYLKYAAEYPHEV